jgi:hypothetical protein
MLYRGCKEGSPILVGPGSFNGAPMAMAMAKASFLPWSVEQPALNALNNYTWFPLSDCCADYRLDRWRNKAVRYRNSGTGLLVPGAMLALATEENHDSTSSPRRGRSGRTRTNPRDNKTSSVKSIAVRTPTLVGIAQRATTGLKEPVLGRLWHELYWDLSVRLWLRVPRFGRWFDRLQLAHFARELSLSPASSPLTLGQVCSRARRINFGAYCDPDINRAGSGRSHSGNSPTCPLAP